ncbi:recombinase family protein [Ohessyouella blattaphilus]|uniref:recombinase family protein n=1 Tax=Ohessyouella blattaphilus TaxID=2949333 RepID=UPI003EB8F625
MRVGFERWAREVYSTCAAQSSYGYDHKNGQRVQTINEAEAETVRLVFDMYVNQGMSLSGIAKNLNLRGISSEKNSYWNSGSVQLLLKNCNYIWHVRYSIHEPNRNFETPGQHEAIISEELFREAQILMEKNSKASPTKSPKEKN